MKGGRHTVVRPSEGDNVREEPELDYFEALRATRG